VIGWEASAMAYMASIRARDLWDRPRPFFELDPICSVNISSFGYAAVFSADF
jgi:hypothetical protein